MTNYQTAYDRGNHARQALLSREVSGHDKNEDCDGNCSDCQSELNVLDVYNNNHKLDGEAKEEEEVEFEEGDVDL